MATTSPPLPEATRLADLRPGLERLGPAGRLAIYRAGGFSREECALWAAHHPDEPPVVNGEYEWIALRLADLD